MRLADLSVDDNTRQAVSVAEAIATGASDTPMVLPALPTNAGSVVGSPYATLNGTLIDDDDDDFLPQETSPFYLEDAFEEHTSDFKGKRKKPKQPGTSIAKLPSQKDKPVATTTPDIYLDDNGNEYEYLGQFDGDTSFLDEKYKGVTVKPGDHLYRRNTGVQFDGELAEYEYSIGDDPESSAIFGKLFKGIGKALKKFTPAGLAVTLGTKAASNLLKRRKKQISNFAGEVIENGGEYYEYLGQTDGDLSFLDYREPNVIVTPGSHIYRIQRTEAFDGIAEYEYFIGAHPEQAEFLGKAFKAIGKAAKAVGKGVGKAAKAVGKTVVKGVKATGKGIGNAAKWTAKKALPALLGQATLEESNGVVAPYNPTAGFEHLGGSGGYVDTDFGDGLYQENSRSEIDSSNVASEQIIPIAPPATENKTLIYLLIAAGVIGLIIYLKKNK